MKLQNWDECNKTLICAEDILSGSSSSDGDPKFGKCPYVVKWLPRM